MATGAVHVPPGTAEAETHSTECTVNGELWCDEGSGALKMGNTTAFNALLTSERLTWYGQKQEQNN